MSSTPDPALASLVQTVKRGIARGKIVRRKLEHGGRIHIERPVPFLCLYRRPHAAPDPGTRRLLESEVAYVASDGSETSHDAARALTLAVLEAESEAFGAVLLMEVWANLDPPALPRASPAFGLVAATRDTPARVLETLENELLNVQCSGRNARVSLSYRPEIAPPDMPPILTAAEARAIPCTHVGLEIDPVYRDPSSGQIFPYKLNELRHGLARALRRGFHAFAHERTSHRPSHYHELGRRSMTRAVWDVDQRLADIGQRFDLVLHVTPVNVPEARRAFESSGRSRMPELHYRPRPVDPGLAKRELYAIDLARLEDPTLEAIFEQKRDELDRQITLVAERNTRRFLLESQQLYSPIDDALRRAADELADTLPAPQRASPSEGPVMDEDAIATAARALIDRYRQSDDTLQSQVQLREDLPGVMVSKGDLLVGTPCRVSPDRIDGLLAHEVETHVLTHHNGRRQRFRELEVGMAGYERLQEGLAVAAEYLVGQLSADRLRVLAARVLAVDALTGGADFVTVFRRLQDRCDLSARSSFDVTVRVFRGGGFTKDAIYLAGLMDVVAHLGSGRCLEELYVGKVALEHLTPIDELRARGVLTAPALLPRFLSDPAARSRVASLARAESPAALALEA